ncbi:anthranilate synthase component II [Polynucleobacter sinensis]|uniref:anthranilate synthase component II n=1 Tax=Polynucleobacter sinensis TaxID=1743157 RepID=UPI0007861CFB|nr:aminodeoxychorismate/anthranilate synthase component II [Polynucleobacter sinensis]
MSPRVIVVDAYDSFVHILVNYLQSIGCFVDLYRNDDARLVHVVQESAGDILLLGPGPGHPKDSGYGNLLYLNAGRMPVLGVCLGHQAIGLYYGCQVEYAKHLMHGKTSRILHDGHGCFKSFGLNAFNAMRYHSIIVSDKNLPREIEISARSEDDDYVMGIRHTSLSIEGIQFHPESIGTEFGIQILQNFIGTHLHN